MGWNNIFIKNNSPIMNGINESDEFYFVHSYHLECEDEDIIIGETDYCYRFVSAIHQGISWHTYLKYD